jgi:hypothetical protein
MAFPLQDLAPFVGQQALEQRPFSCHVSDVGEKGSQTYAAHAAIRSDDEPVTRPTCAAPAAA